MGGPLLIPRSTSEFVALLEKRGDLVRVSAEVDPDQEITIIQHRVLAAEGPALLFERVKGSPYPIHSKWLPDSEQEWQ